MICHGRLKISINTKAFMTIFKHCRTNSQKYFDSPVINNTCPLKSFPKLKVVVMKMRIPLLFMLFSCCYYITASGQTYNKIIKDEEYIDFINKDILRDSVKAKHRVLKRQYPLTVAQFYYKDSADFISKNTYQNQYFIFKRLQYGDKVLTNSLDTLFSRKDIDFFGAQLEAMKPDSLWKYSFKRAKLVDSAEHTDNRRVKHTVYSYSLPLFSFDKSYAIIIKTFYCGLLCGGGAYYVYRRNSFGDWDLVMRINEWGE